MDALIDESPTREKIIMLIKKGGSMTVEEISRSVDITPMGIRQHLMSMEKRGVIRHEVKRQGIGRPVFLYALTNKAEDLFPKTYSGLLTDILEVLEESEGMEKVEQVFRRRKEKILRRMLDVIPRKASLNKRVSSVAGMLGENGYVIELQEKGKRYILKNYNCPISDIASKYRQACRYELELLRGLLGRNVTRTECMADGSLSCTFDILRN